MKRLLKASIWAYLILLIFEGALRKWVMPGAQEALLIIRDPVLIVIYILAVASGVVPRSRFLIALAALVGVSVVFSFLAGQSNLLVTIYGLRTNYLHVPLIWVMAEALDRDDVEKLGSFVVLMVLPMVAVMILQFRSPMDAWINRGVGGDDVGQIYGAAGRIRPPGFFAFITGPMIFFPLAAAFFLHQATLKRRLFLPVLLACGIALVIALPISISRGAMIATLLVAIVYIVCMLSLGLVSGSIVRLAVTSLFLLVVLSFLPIFKEAREVFMDRWDTAAEQSEGHAWGSLGSRVMAGFTQPFDMAEQAPFFGYGIGVGSNVGARLLSGRSGFLLAEDEWSKSLLELGPLLGTGFILYRIVLTGYLLFVCFGALFKNRDPLPMSVWAACAPAILLYQWAPPTLLGFSVFGGGLILASMNHPDDEEEPDGDEEGDEEVEEDEEPAPLIEVQRRRMRGL